MHPKHPINDTDRVAAINKLSLLTLFTGIIVMMCSGNAWALIIAVAATAIVFWFLDYATRVVEDER